MTKVTVDVQVPPTPDVVWPLSSDIWISIADLTDDELRALGEAWTAKLIERAHYIREVRGDNEPD